MYLNIKILTYYFLAVKQGNELDLTVDGVTKKETESGNPQQTSADTNGYLFFGGVEGKYLFLLHLFLSLKKKLLRKCLN